jgi:hypothetical protein
VYLVSDSFNTDPCPRSIQFSVKINGWIARKVRDGLESVRDQVSAWDTLGLEERYVLTKKLLLDKLTIKELDNAIEDGIFTRFEVATHPLFATINQVASTSGELDRDGDSDTDTNALWGVLNRWKPGTVLQTAPFMAAARTLSFDGSYLGMHLATLAVTTVSVTAWSSCQRQTRP